jgi:hypothetical protein
MLDYLHNRGRSICRGLVTVRMRPVITPAEVRCVVRPVEEPPKSRRSLLARHQSRTPDGRFARHRELAARSLADLLRTHAEADAAQFPAWAERVQLVTYRVDVDDPFRVAELLVFAELAGLLDWWLPLATAEQHRREDVN